MIRPDRRVEPEGVAEPSGERGIGGLGDLRHELSRPTAPHPVEVDQRAVLVEDDEVDAVEARPGGPVRCVPGSLLGFDRIRFGLVRRLVEDEARLAGERHPDRVAVLGHRQARVVERVEHD